MFRNEDWNAGDSGLETTAEWLRLFIDNDRAYEAQIRKTFDGFGASIVPYEFTEPWIQYFRVSSVKGTAFIFKSFRRRCILMERKMYETG